MCGFISSTSYLRWSIHKELIGYHRKWNEWTCVPKKKRNDELLVWPKDDHIEMHTIYTNLTNSCILHIYYIWQDIRMLCILLKFVRKSQIYALDKMWYKDIHTRVTGIFLKEQTRDSLPKSTMFVHANHFWFQRRVYELAKSLREHYNIFFVFSRHD